MVADRVPGVVILVATVASLLTMPGLAQDAPGSLLQSEFVGGAIPPEPANGDPWREIEALRARLDQLESANDRQEAADVVKKAADAKKPTVKWSGELQADTYWFNQDSANKAQFGDVENGSDFRRARIAMLGDYGPSEYRIEMDFAQSGRPTFLDVWAGFKDIPGLGRIRAGHFFEPFSLERLTSNRFQTYMERSQVDQAFAPARNLGVGATNTVGEEEVGTWAIGLFNNNSNSYGDATGDRFAGVVTGRVTWLPWYDDHGDDFLHLGFASSYRHTGTGFVQFQAESEARLGATTPNVPFFINTGKIAARTYQLLGWEAALVKGPFSLQSEATLTPVDSTFYGSLLFYGWYVDASYFLTGEHRVYRKEFGVFDRVEPARPFLRSTGTDGVDFGPGAWQVATRLSQVSLNSGAIQGGRQTDLSVGLNWYLNPYTRVYFNYVHAMIDQTAAGSSTCDSLAMRFSFDF